MSRSVPYGVLEENREVVEGLRKEDIGAVFFGEEELAKRMTSHVPERFARRTAASTTSYP